MKVLVTGSRNFTANVVMKKALDRLKPSSIVHGAARGADTLAQNYAKKNNITSYPHPAQWSKYGRSAGMKRNAEMLEQPPLICLVLGLRPLGI